MVACSNIRGQHWMKTVMVKMNMMLKKLMKMALRMDNKDEFLYVILPDSVIYQLIIVFENKFCFYF